MAKLNRSRISLPDASYKLPLQKDVCGVSSVKAKIATLEGMQSGAANTTSSSHTPKLDFERGFMTALTQNVRPSSLRAQSFKPAETQRDTNFSGSSLSSYPKNIMMKSPVKGNAVISTKNSVSFASATPARINHSRQKATTILKPEAQKPNVPSLPKVHQSTKLSIITKEPDRGGGVENIIRTTPPQLPTMQKPRLIRTRGTQNKLQRESTDHPVPKKELPGVLALPGPPMKPNRPPSVDVHRFRRNRKLLNDGPGMKIPHSVVPPPIPPPLHLQPSSNHAATLSKHLDKEETCDDVGIMNPPSHPTEDHLSKRTETKGLAHVIKKTKALVDFKGGKSDSDCVKSDSVDMGHDDLKEKEELELQYELDIYDDIEVKADSGLNIQNDGEDDIYDDIDNPQTSLISPLPQPSTDRDDVYDDVDPQNPLLPFDELDIYEDIREDCIYELD